MSDETRRKAISACCDIFEEDGKILLTLEMPGVTREGLDISVEGDELSISGRRELPGVKNGKYLVKEIRETDYFQKYIIDNTIDRDKIEAAFKNGILNVSLHLKESEKPRQITIKGE
ncbi:MAG: Hsp20/alpha crystallin family protein [Spirochaetales bacterium]|nr:Hsp20/alpha crystallin family protein [Spirochaetales bacterium]